MFTKIDENEIMKLNLSTLRQILVEQGSFAGYQLGTDFFESVEDYSAAIEEIEHKADLVKFIKASSEREVKKRTSGGSGSGKSELEIKLEKEIDTLKDQLVHADTTMRSTTTTGTVAATVVKPKKFDPNMPSYSGKSKDNFEEWLFVVENFQKLHKIGDSDMILMIAPLLKEFALQAYISFVKRSGRSASWNDLKDTLKALSRPEHTERRLRIELKNMHCENDFESFAMRFQSIVNRLPITGKESLFYFTEALKPKMRSFGQKSNNFDRCNSYRSIV